MQTDWEWFIYKILLGLFVVILVIDIVYIYATAFTKTVTITEKQEFASGQGRNLSMKNTVADSEGNVYAIRNTFLAWYFTASENYMKIEKGKTYTIKGYGWRVPILGMYPNITDVKA
jgi:hypothetical protein